MKEDVKNALLVLARQTTWRRSERASPFCSDITNTTTANTTTTAMEPTQDFTSFLIGRPVIVKLNSGVDYRGTWRNQRKDIGKQPAILGCRAMGTF